MQRAGAPRAALARIRGRQPPPHDRRRRRRARRLHPSAADADAGRAGVVWEVSRRTVHPARGTALAQPRHGSRPRSCCRCRSPIRTSRDRSSPPQHAPEGAFAVVNAVGCRRLRGLARAAARRDEHYAATHRGPRIRSARDSRPAGGRRAASAPGCIPSASPAPPPSLSARPIPRARNVRRLCRVGARPADAEAQPAVDAAGRARSDLQIPAAASWKWRFAVGRRSAPPHGHGVH